MKLIESFSSPLRINFNKLQIKLLLYFEAKRTFSIYRKDDGLGIWCSRCSPHCSSAKKSFFRAMERNRKNWFYAGRPLFSVNESVSGMLRWPRQASRMKTSHKSVPQITKACGVIKSNCASSMPDPFTFTRHVSCRNGVNWAKRREHKSASRVRSH